MVMATPVDFMIQASANASRSSLDQHRDVSRDDQVARYKQVTLRQYGILISTPYRGLSRSPSPAQRGSVEERFCKR
jgi:hypothetical protein